MNDTADGNAISKHDKLLFWGCFIALITTAFAFISRMFLIDDPAFGAQFNLDETQKGVLKGIGVWPFAVSIVLFSLFIDKIGYKVAMLFSFAAYLIWSIVGVASYFVAKGGNTETAYTMFYWGSFLLGLSNGTVEAYINPVVATMFSKNKTKWLNILHAGWPGGLVIAGLITIGLGNVEWWIKIGIIAVPAVIFFLMLVPRKFPPNERVAAGVTYREMLAEFGILAAVVVSFLLTLQLIRDVPAVSKEVWIGLGVAAVVAFGIYTRSLGNPFVFVMALIMMPLATTEIGTDGWITGIMANVFEKFHAGWILIYTSAIMCGLRFCAGPIVHKLSPIGLLIISAILAIVGLYTLSFTAGVMIFVAATLYACGKTFFWPTMLGVVSEQSPKGGALTLNALGGVGMLAVGVLGFPYIGMLQDTKKIEAIEAIESIETKAPGLVVDGKLVATTEKNEYGILYYEAVDSDALHLYTRPAGVTIDEEGVKAKPAALTDEQVAALPEESRKKIEAVEAEIEKVEGASKQGALADMAIFPAIMLVAYILMFLYFKSKGGYQAKHLTSH